MRHHDALLELDAPVPPQRSPAAAVCMCPVEQGARVANDGGAWAHRRRLPAFHAIALLSSLLLVYLGRVRKVSMQAAAAVCACGRQERRQRGCGKRGHHVKVLHCSRDFED